MGDAGVISESFLSLVSGLQAALAQLGKCPPHLGTDNSSAATHELEQMPGGRGAIIPITWSCARTTI